MTALATGDFSGFASQLDDLALSFAGLFALMRPMKSLSLLKGAVVGSTKALGGGAAARTRAPLPFLIPQAFVCHAGSTASR